MKNKLLSKNLSKKTKNATAHILFETSEDAKNVPMTWVWHPMGREGLEPATR
ncbi:hypothetical protein PMV56_03485 [Enterococcus avium]|jgi:hypothetical protein|uniref:hypothetical protein n=1 Tax=Enterococcus TaxID=1350 RepID=UPI00160D9B33|nr:hypothetical protein [Enterococcus avium]MDB1728133.1 hypothetical protein [Enterococcus avium]MDB1735445.1 hypothetical protein [Enterococcus avium]MDT2448400.1 hypothetical protein [Enterococcus avium]